MSHRWLSSVLIFALGCLSLVTSATAQEPPADTGELEPGLTYINTERGDSTLVNTGKNIYLFIVQREPGTAPTEEPISYNGDIVRISGAGLYKVVAYRLEPIGVLADELWRSCAMGDCSWIGPFPPPPPPQPHPNPADIKAKISTPQK